MLYEPPSVGCDDANLPESTFRKSQNVFTNVSPLRFNITLPYVPIIGIRDSPFEYPPASNEFINPPGPTTFYYIYYIYFCLSLHLVLHEFQANE